MKPDATAVWDLPTRVFHWLLVGLFAFSWWSAETGNLDWHQKSGLSILALLLFRLMWGMVGSSTARFIGFIRGPGKVIGYMRGSYPAAPGHNPLGGWSVVAMLLVLLVQVATGLFSVDVDGVESGPLSYLVDFDRGREAAAIHHLSFNIFLALIVLHLLAIAFYLIVRRRNLVGPMITGKDPAPMGEAKPLQHGRWWALVISIILAFLATWWIANGAPI